MGRATAWERRGKKFSHLYAKYVLHNIFVFGVVIALHYINFSTKYIRYHGAPVCVSAHLPSSSSAERRKIDRSGIENRCRATENRSLIA